MNKYIIVTGGVCSSLGKGIAAASIGSLLERRGLSVRMIKIDPYINVDAGTMSPYQHGEVFVTDDGAETDLDLGNYARYTNSPLSQANSITTGQIYQEVIQKEREGQYLGRTVQVIPHITDRIKQRIRNIGDAPDVDVTIVEIGGTVGDIESIPFLESTRQLIHDLGRKNILSVHLTLVPMVTGDELKTKPTQHSVKDMMSIGIQPDILLCRAPVELDESMRRKIALFTNVEFDSVISAYDVDTTIYEIPVIYKRQKLDQIILDKLDVKAPEANVADWEKVVKVYTGSKKHVRIAMVGKYIELHDAYKSVDEALYHGGVDNDIIVDLIKIDSENLEELSDLSETFKDIDGILVPGGFGQRGVLGMIKTAKYARENGIPYFGICLGMQVMVIEWARNVMGLTHADSTEFSPDTKDPVVMLLEEQVDVINYGGTMRRGISESKLKAGTQISEMYGSTSVQERHRHRYEVANCYRPQLEKSGLNITGTTPDGALVEAVNWPKHKWGNGVQYHPEFISKPTAPHPMFSSFIKASFENNENKSSKKNDKSAG